MSEVVVKADTRTEVHGVLAESTNIAPSSSRRKARGGKASRARRLEKYHQVATPATPAVPATPTANWERLVRDRLRQLRANLRDDAKAAWMRLRLTRSKICAAAWKAWTCRSLETKGLDIWKGADRQFVTGEELAPLSRRDVWILTRAVSLMMANQARDPYDNIFDPEGPRYYRHVLDWLRVPAEGESHNSVQTDHMILYPHWIHTQRIEDMDMEYTSDEDDRCYKCQEESDQDSSD